MFLPCPLKNHKSKSIIHANYSFKQYQHFKYKVHKIKQKIINTMTSTYVIIFRLSSKLAWAENKHIHQGTNSSRPLRVTFLSKCFFLSILGNIASKEVGFPSQEHWGDRLRGWPPINQRDWPGCEMKNYRHSA